MALVLATAFVLAFAVTNGFLDAAHAIATLVGTRGARPATAILLAAAGNVVGAMLIGTAVAGTIAGIVTVQAHRAVAVVGAGALAATGWNLLMWWRGLPSSSGHALVGGLAGAGFAQAGIGAVRWGGVGSGHPHGLAGALLALAVSPPLGFALAVVTVVLMRRLMRRAAARTRRPVRAGQWLASAALSVAHGANDGQKSMGAIAALLLASGHLHSFAVPSWVKLACAASLTLGTALGGWRIVATVGRGIYRLTPVDALAGEVAAAGVIVGAAFAGAPVSTTHVVSSSVVGVGAGRRRFRHVRWSVVTSMAYAWAVTLPASAVLGALLVVAWNSAA